MQTTRLCSLLVFVAISVFFLISCDLGNNDTAIEPVRSQSRLLSADQTASLSMNNAACYVLYAGQSIPVGTVLIANTDDTLRVIFSANTPWVLFETHLAMANNQAGIPHTKNGNPVPGRFADAASHQPPVSIAAYEIPLNGHLAGDTLLIAAHAAVGKMAANGIVVQTESAWSAGMRFVARGNWATYSTYQVQEFSSPTNQPPEPEPFVPTVE